MKKLLIVDDSVGSDAWLCIAGCFSGYDLKIFLPEKYKDTIRGNEEVNKFLENRVENTNIDFESTVLNYSDYMSDVNFSLLMPCGINTFANLVNGYVNNGIDICVALAAQHGITTNIILNIPDLLSATPGLLSNIKRSADCPYIAVRRDILGISEESLGRLRGYLNSLKEREGKY